MHRGRKQGVVCMHAYAQRQEARCHLLHDMHLTNCANARTSVFSVADVLCLGEQLASSPLIEENIRSVF